MNAGDTPRERLVDQSCGQGTEPVLGRGDRRCHTRAPVPGLQGTLSRHPVGERLQLDHGRWRRAARGGDARPAHRHVVDRCWRTAATHRVAILGLDDFREAMDELTLVSRIAPTAKREEGVWRVQATDEQRRYRREGRRNARRFAGHCTKLSPSPRTGPWIPTRATGIENKPHSCPPYMLS